MIQEKLTSQTKKDKNRSESSNRKRTATQTQEETIDSIITIIPNSDSDLRRWYIDGSYSILKNLPYPKVILFKNDSYVSIRQCIADYLGKGYSADKPTMNNTSRYIHKLIDSLIANIVFDRATKVNPGVNTNDILVILGV